LELLDEEPAEFHPSFLHAVSIIRHARMIACLVILSLYLWFDSLAVLTFARIQVGAALASASVLFSGLHRSGSIGARPGSEKVEADSAISDSPESGSGESRIAIPGDSQCGRGGSNGSSLPGVKKNLHRHNSCLALSESCTSIGSIREMSVCEQCSFAVLAWLGDSTFVVSGNSAWTRSGNPRSLLRTDRIKMCRNCLQLLRDIPLLASR
jgi:hypothetical protein